MVKQCMGCQKKIPKREYIDRHMIHNVRLRAKLQTYLSESKHNHIVKDKFDPTFIRGYKDNIDVFHKVSSIYLFIYFIPNLIYFFLTIN